MKTKNTFVKRIIFLIPKIFGIFLLTTNCIQPTSNCFSQNSFQLLYGTGDYDFGIGLSEAIDTGFVFIGYTGLSNPISYLTKTDAKGVIQWSKLYGGGSFDVGQCVFQESSGDILVGGYTTSFGAGGGDFFLTRVSSSGSLVWSKTYGGTSQDYCKHIAPTTGGGVIMAGETSGFGAGGIDVYLVKTDNTGAIQWTSVFGGTGWDRGESVEQTADGGYIVGAFTDSFGAGNNDVYLIKTDASGAVQWSKTYGGAGDDYVYRSVFQAKDKGYLVSGYTNSFGAGSLDFFVMKTDSLGVLEWFHTYGGPGDDWGSTVIQTSDGGYAITGDGDSYGAGSQDIYLIKLNSSGNFLWAKAYGSPGNEYNVYVKETFDKGFVMGGTTDGFASVQNSFYLVKTDSLGNVNCNMTDFIPVITNPPVTVTSPPALSSSGGTITSPSFIANNPIQSSSIICPDTSLSVSISHTNVKCFGDSNGTATANPTGGKTPYTYLWNTLPVQTTQTITGLSVGAYTVIVTDANDTITAVVSITQPTLLTSTVTCAPAACGSNSGSATVNAGGGTPAYSYSWNPSGLTTQTITGLGAGTYTVTVTDANGCTVSDTVTIVVYPTPTASFICQPQSTSILNPVIQFTDSSIYNISSWLWSFGDNENGSSTIQNPKYTYADSGTYVVQLIVTDIHGCTDTTQHTIIITADYIFHAPNSFTPNNDGINDIFIPQTEIIVSAGYSLIIFDRWGNKVFESNDHKKGWDGKIKNTNTVAQEDVYIWMVKLSDFNHQQHEYTGKVTILK